jgi:cysteinyl-tRNA synthetase
MYKSFFIFLLALILFVPACKDDGYAPKSNTNYRQEMRTFVIAISHYAKTQHQPFFIIPQNGIELVTKTGNETGSPATDYLKAIDGNGQEDLLYGYDADNKPTAVSETNYLKRYLNLAKAAGKTILVTDYCSDKSKMADSYTRNSEAGYTAFAANHRELDDIPDYPVLPFNENADNIARLSRAKNFLYLINPERYNTKTAFMNAIKATNYDVIIMDLFFNDGSAFTPDEIGQLKTKANDGRRLVICYLSIGEAEDYRYYWNPDWKKHPPSWLAGENPNWPGDYKVKYWDAKWQAIIYGNDSSYLHKILTAGFDGAYLDIVDAFEYFEGK